MRSMRPKVLVFGLSMLIGIGLLASMATAAHNVPGDSGTITAALAAATPSDTIFVAAGVYSPSTNGETFPLLMTQDSPEIS